MPITNNVLVRVNTADSRRALIWFEKNTSGEPHTAATLAAFTTALGGAATNRNDVEIPTTKLTAYDTLAEIRAADLEEGLTVAADGTVATYSQANSVTAKVRRAELREILRESVMGVGVNAPARESFWGFTSKIVDAAKTEGNLTTDAHFTHLRGTAEALTAGAVMAGRLTQASVGTGFARDWLRTGGTGISNFYPVTKVGDYGVSFTNTPVTITSYDTTASNTESAYHVALAWIFSED